MDLTTAIPEWHMFPQFTQVYACEYLTIWPRCLATSIIEGDDFYWDHINSNENYHSPPTTTKCKAKNYVLRKVITKSQPNFWLSKFRQVSHLFFFQSTFLSEVLWCKPKSGTLCSQRSKVQEQSPWTFFTLGKWIEEKPNFLVKRVGFSGFVLWRWFFSRVFP